MFTKECKVFFSLQIGGAVWSTTVKKFAYSTIQQDTSKFNRLYYMFEDFRSIIYIIARPINMSLSTNVKHLFN